MEAILLEWGTEIILSLVIAFLTYYFKKSDKEKDKRMEHYQEMLNHEKEEQTKKAVEVQLEPIYKELEEIRKRIFSLQDCHIDDVQSIKDIIDDREKAMRDEVEANFKLLQENMDLIISSYKYRLVELCRGL